MNNRLFVSIADLVFPFQYRFSETQDFFRNYVDTSNPVINTAVSMSDKDWEFYLNNGMEYCSHTECSASAAVFSDALMEYNGLILHAVALRWQGKAYLITAKSGVGKTTQARFLQELQPGKFGIICGDRTAVRFKQDELIVYPTPWNGKENWYGAEKAPLAGIILLSRGNENAIKQISAREASIPFYKQVIQTCSLAEKIHISTELITRILENTPVWQLNSCQVPDSTKLLIDKVFSF